MGSWSITLGTPQVALAFPLLATDDAQPLAPLRDIHADSPANTSAATEWLASTRARNFGRSGQALSPFSRRTTPLVAVGERTIHGHKNNLHHRLYILPIFQVIVPQNAPKIKLNLCFPTEKFFVLRGAGALAEVEGDPIEAAPTTFDLR
jgi:hypothetical protein